MQILITLENPVLNALTAMSSVLSAFKCFLNELLNQIFFETLSQNKHKKLILFSEDQIRMKGNHSFVFVIYFKVGRFSFLGFNSFVVILYSQIH